MRNDKMGAACGLTGRWKIYTGFWWGTWRKTPLDDTGI